MFVENFSFANFLLRLIIILIEIAEKNWDIARFLIGPLIDLIKIRNNRYDRVLAKLAIPMVLMLFKDDFGLTNTAELGCCVDS